MRRVALASLLALAAACSTSPCQELGERICQCQPGTTKDTCKTQVQNQLKNVSPDEGFCQGRLNVCNAPEGVDFCEWLLTAPGKTACGLTPAAPAAP